MAHGAAMTSAIPTPDHERRHGERRAADAEARRLANTLAITTEAALAVSSLEGPRGGRQAAASVRLRGGAHPLPLRHRARDALRTAGRASRVRSGHAFL